MHGIRRDILLAQAEAAGLPLIEARIPQQCDNATYETAFADALAQARERWPGLETIAFGDLFLADVRAWREALCARLGWRIETPLFGADTSALAQNMPGYARRLNKPELDRLKQLAAQLAKA